MQNIEEKLVTQCKNGDISALEKLFYILKDNVYSIAFRILGNEQDAEDITQEVFIKIWLNLTGFNMKSSIRTWVYKIAVNLCYDLQKKRNNLIEEPIEDFDAFHSDEEPFILLTKKELEEKVEKFFLMLSLDSRLVLTLKELEGLSYNEIADILGCTINSAKMKGYRARVEFKKIVMKYLRDGKDEL